jgi:hypothetical protein
LHKVIIKATVFGRSGGNRNINFSSYPLAYYEYDKNLSKIIFEANITIGGNEKSKASSTARMVSCGGKEEKG